MYGNDNRDVSINKPIRMWANLPIDGRLVTPSLNELDDKIHFPYVGMIFYSEFEDKYYKVLSVEDGYRNNRIGRIIRINADYAVNPIDIIPGYFVGTYEEYENGAKESRSITSTNIDTQGYLHIIYTDGVDEKVGKVVGNEGPIGPSGPSIELMVDNRQPDPFIQYRPVTDPPSSWIDLYDTGLLKGKKGDTGSQGPQGPGVQLRVTDENELQTKATNASPDKWTFLFDLNELKGETGSQGPTGRAGEDGEDGREIVVRGNNQLERLEWKYEDEPNSSYRFLVSYDDLKGPQGEQGPAGADGQDGARGMGIKGARVNVLNNHLILILDDDSEIDAGTLPAGSQTIDADLHELIFGDGNDWAEGSSTYFDVLQNTPSSPSVPEREEYRLSIKENDNNKNKQFMITNQIVDGKSLETLDSEAQTYNSNKIRQYDSDYYKFIMKDTAKCILGGESEIDIDNDTTLRLHGGLIEMDDWYGNYNPQVVLRGYTFINLEGCTSYDQTKYHGETEYSGYIQAEVSHFSNTPTLEELLECGNLTGWRTEYHYTSYFKSTSSGNQLSTNEDTLEYYNIVTDSENYDITIGDVTRTGWGTYYYRVNISAKSGAKFYARKTYTRQYPFTWTTNDRANPTTDYNDHVDSFLFLKDNALLELREGSVLKMAGSPYINCSGNSRTEVVEDGFIHVENYGYLGLRDYTSIYMDHFNSINMATTGGRQYDYTDDDTCIPTTIESDGSNFNIGPTKTATFASSTNDWPRINHAYIDGLGDSDSNWQKSCTDQSGSTTRNANLKRLAHPSTGMPLVKRFTTDKTFTLDEIKLGFKDMGFEYICTSEKFNILKKYMIRGNAVCDPSCTEAIIAKLEADGYPLDGKSDMSPWECLDPAVTLIPKKGKIKEAHDFDSYYFDSQFGWVNPRYYNRITSQTGWEDIFDKVVIAKFSWDKRSDAYKKYSNSVSWGNLIYLTPAAPDAIDGQYQVKYWNLLDTLSTKYPSSFSGLDTEDAISSDTTKKCFSRLTEAELPTINNADPLELFFEEEDTDTYRPNYLIEGLLSEKVFPTVHLCGDVMLNLGAKNYRTFLQMTGKEGETSNVYIMNNSFIHHSGNSHEEMHDGSMLIMRSPTFEAAYKSYKMPWTDYTGPDINQKYFSSPIQIHDNGPLINMYDKATFHMSGTWITDEDEVDFWTKATEYKWIDNQWQYIHHDYIQFITSTEADPTEGLDQQAIDDLNAQLAADGEGCVYSSGGTVTVISHPVSGGYTLKITGFKVKYTGPEGWSRYATKIPGSPVLELTQDAELRLHDSFSIKADNDGIEFSDGTDSVKFTIAELKALKNSL